MCRNKFLLQILYTKGMLNKNRLICSKISLSMFFLNIKIKPLIPSTEKSRIRTEFLTNHRRKFNICIFFSSYLFGPAQINYGKIKIQFEEKIGLGKRNQPEAQANQFYPSKFDITRAHKSYSSQYQTDQIQNIKLRRHADTLRISCRDFLSG